MSDDTLGAAARLLAGSRRVLVSTGAGMSRESGVPTLRDALEGLWAQYDPRQLATEQGFRANPARVWIWYAERRRRIEACAPHAGHRALAEMQNDFAEWTLVTQNIDGLHALAGSTDVLELHGNIRRTRCLDRDHPAGDALLHPTGEESRPPARSAGPCSGRMWYGSAKCSLPRPSHVRGRRRSAATSSSWSGHRGRFGPLPISPT